MAGRGWIRYDSNDGMVERGACVKYRPDFLIYVNGGVYALVDATQPGGGAAGVPPRAAAEVDQLADEPGGRRQPGA